MRSPAALVLASATAALALPQVGGGSGGAAVNNSAAIKCPLVLDGRIPAATTLADFDDGTTPFLSSNVKSSSLLWSQILLFPNVSNARFDPPATDKSVEVQVTQASIFNNQQGFRRAGLVFNADSNSGSPAATGVKTLHFSVMQDPARALNLSHEYLNVWHETTDYSADQVMFEIGTIIGQESLPKTNFKIFGRQMNLLWSTAVAKAGWQNFAITLDYTANTLQIYYSAGSSPLVKQLASPVSNDNSGGGQFQIGILKKPTGTTDVVNSGYQEPSFDEGQIYGSIFVEDSANGCISL